MKNIRKLVSKTNSTPRKLVSLLTFLTLSFATLCLTSCLGREEIEATVWLNNFPIPGSMIEKMPEICDRGFYRKLSTGKIEFISSCKRTAKDMRAIHKDDLKRIMDNIVSCESNVAPMTVQELEKRTWDIR